MKRKLVAGLLIASLLITMVGGLVQAEAKPEYKWKMALNGSDGDNAYDTGAVFAEKVAELTGGRVKIDLYGGGALGNTAEVFEGMSVGVADLMVESVGTLAPFNKLANIDAIPYLYSSYEHFMTVWNSDLGNEMKDAIGNPAGFKIMGRTFRGPRIVSSTYEMRELKDFAGFKIRVPNLDVYLKTWQHMGAAPMPLAFGELYTALQQGTVNGQENPMADSINYAFDEVCKYWIKTNHVYSCNVVVMDLNKFNSLPEDIQSAMLEAATYAGDVVSLKQLELMKTSEQALIDKGHTIIEVDIPTFVEHFKTFSADNYSDIPEFADWSARIAEMNPDK
jgi:tripartite ATP-independent transporter DctP family solute receptor